MCPTQRRILAARDAEITVANSLTAPINIKMCRSGSINLFGEFMLENIKLFL